MINPAIAERFLSFETVSFASPQLANGRDAKPNTFESSFWYMKSKEIWIC